MEKIHVKFDELTTMASVCNNSEPETNCTNFQDSSEDSQSVPSKTYLDNLFGPLYKDYYSTSSLEVSDNSAPNTLDNENTSSSSSIVVEEDEAPKIVSSSAEQIANEPNSPVLNENVNDLVQEDVAEFDGNIVEETKMLYKCVLHKLYLISLITSCHHTVFHMAQQVIPAAQLVPRYPTIGRCNNYVVLQSIPCSPECKIVGNISLDHPLSYALTATADVPVVYLQQFWRTVSKVPDTEDTIKFMLDIEEFTYTVDMFLVTLHLSLVSSI
ncbi:hypothetical protein Tco_0237590 [Tanacetum coccineum]